VAQTMYTHVSKCKNDKRKKEKENFKKKSLNMGFVSFWIAKHMKVTGSFQK
jgi:hypothetical protein